MSFKSRSSRTDNIPVSAKNVLDFKSPTLQNMGSSQYTNEDRVKQVVKNDGSEQITVKGKTFYKAVVYKL